MTYMSAYGLNVLLLLPQQGIEIFLVHDLHIGLTLSLLVLKRAVEKEDARILYSASHFRVRHVYEREERKGRKGRMGRKKRKEGIILGVEWMQ